MKITVTTREGKTSEGIGGGFMQNVYGSDDGTVWPLAFHLDLGDGSAEQWPVDELSSVHIELETDDEKRARYGVYS